MHNIHVVVLRAVDGPQAVATVLKEFAGWGTPDNYKTFQIAFSESGQVFVEENPRWPLYWDTSWLNRNALNEALGDVISNTGEWEREVGEVLASRQGDITQLAPNECWRLARAFENLAEIKSTARLLDGVPFDLFTDEHRRWGLSEFGVTHQTDDHGLLVGDPDCERWAVVLDVHS